MAQKLGGATALMRQEKIKQMVRDLGLLRQGRLGRADIHVAIELAGIDVDDLSVERLCNGQGKSRFPHRSGPTTNGSTWKRPLARSGATPPLSACTVCMLDFRA